jgi:hypothetical protein
MSENSYTTPNPFDKYNENKLYKLIRDYYLKYSDIYALEYTFHHNGESQNVKTLLGVDKENRTDIDKISVKDSVFTEYDEDVIDSIGFEVLDDKTNNLTDIVYKIILFMLVKQISSITWQFLIYYYMKLLKLLKIWEI